MASRLNTIPREAATGALNPAGPSSHTPKDEGVLTLDYTGWHLVAGRAKLHASASTALFMRAEFSPYPEGGGDSNQATQRNQHVKRPPC